MGERGRRSASELGVTSVDGKPYKLIPPDHLGTDERRRFVELVAYCDAGHLRPSDVALLCRYVEADALGERAAKELRGSARCWMARRALGSSFKRKPSAPWWRYRCGCACRRKADLIPKLLAATKRNRAFTTSWRGSND